MIIDPAGIPALLDAIRHLHGCEARWVDRTRSFRYATRSFRDRTRSFRPRFLFV